MSEPSMLERVVGASLLGAVFILSIHGIVTMQGALFLTFTTIIGGLALVLCIMASVAAAHQ